MYTHVCTSLVRSMWADSYSSKLINKLLIGCQAGSNSTEAAYVAVVNQNKKEDKKKKNKTADPVDIGILQ